MNRHIAMIRRAYKVAMENPYRWQHGCVVAKGRKMVSFAPNKYRNSPKVCPDYASIHAEVAAIRMAQTKGA